MGNIHKTYHPITETVAPFGRKIVYNIYHDIHHTLLLFTKMMVLYYLVFDLFPGLRFEVPIKSQPPKSKRTLIIRIQTSTKKKLPCGGEQLVKQLNFQWVIWRRFQMTHHTAQRPTYHLEKPTIT